MVWLIIGVVVISLLILYYIITLFYLVVESTGYYKKIDKAERRWIR